MSGDREQEYFADGTVEEITTAAPRLQKCLKKRDFSKAFGGVGCAVLVTIVSLLVPLE
jgi:TolB-like protein